MMNIEVRADGARITGYVNVTEKKSRPVITPRGKVVEEIEPRAFSEAIDRAGNITVTVDHDKSHIYASTDDGTVTLKEDAIGLHADVLIKDKDLIELAKKGKIRGWSFGMYNVKDTMEARADDLPIRHITGLDLDHLTLVVKKYPIYSATSVELRAGEDIDLETRASLDEPTTQYTVKLAVVHVYAGFVHGRNVTKLYSPLTTHHLPAMPIEHHGCGACRGGAAICRHTYLLERVPLSTIRTAPHPFLRLLPTVGTHVCYLVFCHLLYFAFYKSNN